MRIRALFATLVWLAALSSACPAGQDDVASYPNRPIHIVVPFPAGGPSDLVSRIIGQKMSETLGQPVVIDNRPGGNTIIGAQAVARAAPDGYTLLMAIDSTLVMNQFLYKSLPYDPFTDFAPITLTTQTVSVLAVRSDGPQTVQELIARAKANPGKLNFGGGTITAQLMGHLFHKAAGLDIVYVPFKGTPETTQGLLAGSVDLVYASTVIAIPLIKGGQVRALARMDHRELPALAGVPVLKDAAGLASFDDLAVWLGLVAPRETPRAIIDKLNREVVRILNDPAVKQKSEATGGYIQTSTPEEFAAFMRREAARWGPALKDLGLHYD
ncbi:MAG TPA: tripartite tricarboxylate transporter substrate binding protein [Xanthobacteraceae bacterium]|nr:tripartite tricarboxylate transporter substrate binding protein [Xanthobacteraceae bacterium]